MAPQTFQLSILVEYEATDERAARYVEGRARTELREMFPDAHVVVRAGQVRWLPLDERAA